MILSNMEIINCMNAGLFDIGGIAGKDPTRPPFNTSAVDLRLGDEVFEPDQVPTPSQLDLTNPGIAQLLAKNGQSYKISKSQPYSLSPNKLILARTLETVDFPLLKSSSICYSARVEGKSSLARCGILVHFTAPTIHAGFHGSITLEIINLGIHSLLLTPEMYVCQLIIEEVKGIPSDAPSQFHGQSTAVGNAHP
ncbi:dCTP deaminase [Pseudomonas chlororaphis]